MITSWCPKCGEPEYPEDTVLAFHLRMELAQEGAEVAHVYCCGSWMDTFDKMHIGKLCKNYRDEKVVGQRLKILGA